LLLDPGVAWRCPHEGHSCDNYGIQPGTARRTEEGGGLAG
jgi:hypothetical protein